MNPLCSGVRFGLSLLVLLAACNAPMSARPERGAGNRGEVVTLDDVTNGLVASPARTGDGFGFTSFGKSAFADTDEDGLPDTRLPAAGESMMVYHGAMTVEVARAEEAIAAFLTKVKQWGGHLSTQQDRQVTVRVPSPRFEEAMTELRAMGRVLAESRQADDVTKQFTDLGIRLDNARKGRDRLLQLLEKAQKVEDMLAIEKELRRLTEEIETMEGERRFLADQVAMATLQAEFRSVAAPGPQSRRRLQSRFDWVNLIGVDAAREDF